MGGGAELSQGNSPSSSTTWYGGIGVTIKVAHFESLIIIHASFHKVSRNDNEILGDIINTSSFLFANCIVTPKL